MKLRTKTGALALALCFAFTAAMPTFAAETESAKTFDVKIDAVEENLGIGEAKFAVGVSGAAGATDIQLSFDFEGELAYDDVKFLFGTNNLPDGMWIYPTANKANAEGKFTLAILGDEKFSENQDLFVISFTGDAGKAITLTLNNTDEASYCKIGSDYIFPSNSAEKTLTGSATGTSTKKASVRLSIDKVSGFTSTNDPAFSVIFTRDDGFVSSVAVSNTSDGHRVLTSDGTTVFQIDKTVLEGRSYTVEILGVGYIPYKKTNVSFDDEATLKITNAEFVPGDVNGDNKVDGTDKKIVAALVANADDEEYSEYKDSADFNRNGSVDKFDLDVLADIPDSTESGTDTPNDDNGNDSSQGGSDDDGEGGSGGGNGGNSSGGGLGGGISGGTSATPTDNEAFVDLANYAWAKESIYTLKDKGIISGVSDTEFAPANNIKRGDFILILTRMLGISDEFTENFADVPEGAYYYNAIGSAKAAGIASGDGENFLPENTITRQDLITLAYRAFLNKGYITETDDLSVLDAFSDNDDISEYAQKAMASMVKAGIIQGADGLVNPQGFATRAEVAVMCARMANLMK